MIVLPCIETPEAQIFDLRVLLHPSFREGFGDREAAVDAGGHDLDARKPVTLVTGGIAPRRSPPKGVYSNDVNI